MSSNEKAPTLFFQERRLQAAYALPSKREREHTPLLSSLSRLRGRVARSSERDGWGQLRSKSRATILNFEIPDRSALRAAGMTTIKKEDTP
jgi:hypothetical protein